ncbi:MAG: flavocytochrome c [Clostridia bacterium]|nr:flavocytochrome c [Clostridia bacterium]
MKKVIALMLTVVMLLGCAAVAEGSYVPGAYEKVEPGLFGDIQVTVTVSDSAIESIAVESNETDTIGVAAMDALTQVIVDNQSLAVDTTTGATISTTAYLKAVKAAIAEAGGDVAALEAAAIAKEEAAMVTSADIIVVGAGAAGMSAAITAADKGASVILLEKSSRTGGNTICSANGINAADSAVQLADEKYIAAGASKDGLKSLQMNNEAAIETLVDAFVSNSGATIDWMSGLGVEFTVDIAEDNRNSQQNYYMLKATADGSTAITMVNAVSKRLEETSVNVYYNMDATSLITDENGAVTGVVAIDESGNKVSFTGKAVILCTGGFGQNNELVGQVNPYLANAVTDEVSPTTGEGLLMAQALGAAAVNLDAIQTFPAVVPGYGMILPFALPGGFTPDAIYVNNQAQRFTAEGFEIPDALLAQDKGEVYCVFTEKNLNGTLEGLYNAGYAVKGETAAEIAQQLGLDAEALQATIQAFNEDIADGVDDAFGRDRNLNPIEGTLYGYRFGVGAHYFMGGLLINDQTQVLKEDGTPIEGLYAAGEVTGGFHGTFRVDGSGLGDSFTFGRIAGETVADKVLSQKAADQSAFLSILTEGKTNWNFTTEPVDEDDLQVILQAGVNTASAVNEQPWLINVITDPEIIAELADTQASAKAPVMILISVINSNEMKILDAGLTCQSMQIAARALGYATKIETAAARTVRKDQTGKWAQLFGIPEDKSARAALFIGHADAEADAVSSASLRKDMSEVVTYITGK